MGIHAIVCMYILYYSAWTRWRQPSSRAVAIHGTDGPAAIHGKEGPETKVLGEMAMMEEKVVMHAEAWALEFEELLLAKSSTIKCRLTTTIAPMAVRTQSIGGAIKYEDT